MKIKNKRKNKEIMIREELARFALKEEEVFARKLRSIIASIPDPIIIFDILGKIEQINEATKKKLGYLEIELLGKEAFFIKNQDIFQELLKEVFKKRSIENIELTLLTKEKKEFPCLVNLALVTDLKGRPLQIICVFRDISEIKKLLSQLEEKTETFQKKVIELEKFHRLAVGRELKMIELKKRIKELEKNSKVENN